MPWEREDRPAQPKLNRRLFANTQHPAIHDPRWRRLGTRGKHRWPHRVCTLCGHMEYRTMQGNWVKETTCRHQ